MKIRNWKSWFEPHILLRGSSYAKDGNVEDIDIHEDGTVTATVYGSDEYNVEIEIANDEIVDMDCDCPYSEDGNYCKHEAAVLYVLTSNEDDDSSFDDEDDEDDDYYPTIIKRRKRKKDELNLTAQESGALSNLIGNMSLETAKEALLAITGKSRSAYEYIWKHYGIEVELCDIEQIKTEINDAADDFSDENYFIDSYSAGGYFERLNEILEYYVPVLLEKGRYIDAFEVSSEAIIAICNQEIDDSNGEIWEMSMTVRDYWSQIASNAKVDECNQILMLLEEMEESEDSHDVIREMTFEFMHEGFENKNIQDAVFRRDMEYLKAGGSDRKSDRYSMVAEAAASHLCSTNASIDDLMGFLHDYGKYGNVTDCVLDYLKKNELTDYELPLLENMYRRKADNHSSMDKIEIAARISEILSARGEQAEAALLYRKAILYDCYAREIKEFLLLKKLDTEESWKKDKDSIYYRYIPEKCGAAVLELMIEENDIDLVFKALNEIQFGLDSIFERLEDDLIRIDPERAFKVHKRVLNGRLLQCSNRKYYQYQVWELNKIAKSYPDGKRLACELADEWKQSYSNRSALLDELSKAGY